ncbi:MAG TPA: ABC transporter permease [Polyangiales bacterium]|nr:ABC transporter permease [Polyangiales bacterium]
MRAIALLLVPLATIGVELLAVCASLGLFAVFLTVVGAPPLAVFADMLQGAFGSMFSLQNSLSRAAPLMLTALCTALPARMGLVVIGNEGALLLGGLTAAATAMALGGTLGPGLLLPAMLIFAAAVGGGWIALSGWLRQKRGVNETISSLLLFYIGLGIFLYLVEGPLRDPSSLNKPSTYPVGEANMLGNLPGMDVHYGLLFGVVACLLAYVLMEHTTFGFAARVVGGNPRAAQVAGLPITRLMLTVCTLAGAAAGLAGAVEVVAVEGSANSTLYAGLGFAGVLVAFVARQHALAILIVAVLMGGIEASGGVLQRRHDLPDAAVDVFKGILFLVILASETYVARAQAFAQRWVAEHAPAESATGSPVGSVAAAPRAST